MNTPASTPSRRGIGMIIKIAFACILLAAIATIGTALTCSILSGSRLESLAQNRLQATASLMKSKLTSLQDHYQSASRQLAGSSLIRRALTDLQQDPASANARGLLRAGFELSGADGVYLVGSDGTILAQEGGVVTSETWATGMYPTADLIQSVSQTGELAAAFWSSPKNDADSRFFYALPVEGTDRSVVLVEFSADELIQTIQFEGRPRDAGLGETGECYLIGSDKVARTPVRTGMGNQMDSEGVRRALAREEGSSIYANYSGDTVIGAYTSFQGPGQNWGLLVEQGQAEALAGAGNPILVNTGIAIAFIILIGIGALIWAKLFVRPIQALDETMRRISDGDDNARSPVLSHDEIGQLAENFNRLVEERNTARDRVTTDSKRLQNNIQELLLVVADASEGKLSVHARKTEGILGNVADALNRMLQNVGVLIGEAKNASSQVEQAAAEISAYAEALTQGAAQQSEQVNQTIQDVETMTVEAQNVSQNSREAAVSATQTREAAEKGASAVRDTVAFMERLQENVQATSNKINELGNRSEEISGIVQSISEISAETDVLAMNASIEAARAGEQGKGFTIVADQVRALADRTRLATVEIEKLVRGIQNETSEAVRQMDSQNQEVINGVRQVTSAGKELSNIVETSVDSSTLAEQISQSSTEQETRAQAVLNAIVAINQVAEETRARTVEFQQTSTQLAMLANELNAQLANFETEETAPPTIES
jgi:methyl-accepting chemotaxis protein